MRARFFRSSTRILTYAYLGFKRTSLSDGEVKKLKSNIIAEVRDLLAAAQDLQKHFFSDLEPPLFAYFDSILSLMEKILVSLSQESSLDGEMFRNILSYLDDCEQRILRLKQAVSSSDPVIPAKLFHYRKGLYRKSCFFCSSPLFYSWGEQSTVPGAPQGVKVPACSSCRSSVEKKKKTSILFFSQKGKQLHWSHDQSYIPSADYWQMNQ